MWLRECDLCVIKGMWCSCLPHAVCYVHYDDSFWGGLLSVIYSDGASEGGALHRELSDYHCISLHRKTFSPRLYLSPHYVENLKSLQIIIGNFGLFSSCGIFFWHKPTSHIIPRFDRFLFFFKLRNTLWKLNFKGFAFAHKTGTAVVILFLSLEYNNRSLSLIQLINCLLDFFFGNISWGERKMNVRVKINFFSRTAVIF